MKTNSIIKIVLRDRLIVFIKRVYTEVTVKNPGYITQIRQRDHTAFSEENAEEIGMPLS